jgi:hypothetical protein
MAVEDSRVREAFKGKQRQLLAALELVPMITEHGTTIGDDSEANWARALREFLPKRYGVGSGQVIDSRGAISQQIDLLVYDPQYSPLFAKTSADSLFIPAEAVYAVFEVKQQIDKPLTDYAGNKIASVRRLHRTSVSIAHAGGVYDPKPPTKIVGGILTTRSGWASLGGRAAAKQLQSLTGDRRIDIGCALGSASFDLPDDDPDSPPVVSEPDTTLLFFLFRLYQRLQGLGTVAAVDIGAYARCLDLAETSHGSGDGLPGSANLG